MDLSAPPVLLDIDDVSKRHGRVQALDSVSLTVRAGELVCLMGPNGAGKTTLFQILAGLIAADAGRARVLGHDVAREPVAALSAIGLVFQQPTLDPELSVAANLRFHCRLHGLARRIAAGRIEAALRHVQLQDRQNEPVRHLSGGNRRRIELARAFLHNPRLLLMDEPTVGLDPQSRRDLFVHALGLCSERGLGILWATHLVDEAEKAHRVVILHRGRVHGEGAPAELAARQNAGTLERAFFDLVGGSDTPRRMPATVEELPEATFR